jgi:hypothetical protein
VEENRRIVWSGFVLQGELYTSSSLTNLIPFPRYKAIEAELTMAGRFSRPLQPGESRWDMLQRLTTDETGNSVLSNAFPLAALGMFLCFSARKYHVD